ncbi:hypothetical protein DM01DRAFT_1303761 [Hesseltinella vesiculosa]|uniref:Uncharacterized protein n=1 Tax=Hesseltinella vesiculosa TaxID=101127 RepID=A0A1X2GL97_9FUNG|nr:hypothetical protein DM01DRAFT_1303761 [Hesseltinella vesiculosa]
MSTQPIYSEQNNTTNQNIAGLKGSSYPFTPGTSDVHLDAVPGSAPFLSDMPSSAALDHLQAMIKPDTIYEQPPSYISIDHIPPAPPPCLTPVQTPGLSQGIISPQSQADLASVAPMLLPKSNPPTVINAAPITMSDASHLSSTSAFPEPALVQPADVFQNQPLAFTNPPPNVNATASMVIPVEPPAPMVYPSQHVKDEQLTEIVQQLGVSDSTLQLQQQQHCQQTMLQQNVSPHFHAHDPLHGAFGFPANQQIHTPVTTPYSSHPSPAHPLPHDVPQNLEFNMSAITLPPGPTPPAPAGDGKRQQPDSDEHRKKTRRHTVSTPQNGTASQRVATRPRRSNSKPGKPNLQISLPPPPTPAELGLKNALSPATSLSINSTTSTPAISRKLAMASSAFNPPELVSPEDYENMPRDQLIARLVELETEIRAQQTSSPSLSTTNSQAPLSAHGSISTPSPFSAADGPVPLTQSKPNVTPIHEEDEDDDEDEDDEDDDHDHDPQQHKQPEPAKPTSKKSKARYSDELHAGPMKCGWTNCGIVLDGLKLLNEHLSDVHVCSGKVKGTLFSHPLTFFFHTNVDGLCV